MLQVVYLVDDFSHNALPWSAAHTDDSTWPRPGLVTSSGISV